MTTEPVLTVERRPVSPLMAKYPMGTLTGVLMLEALIEGGRIWSGCTNPQKTVLDALCRPVFAQLLEAGSLRAEDLPELPGGTTAQMRAALRRRGLNDNGRITGRAVYAWYWAVEFKERDDG